MGTTWLRENRDYNRSGEVVKSGVLAPWHVRALAIALAVASLWPLSGVFNWLGVNVATLEQLSRTDPQGFRIFPAVLMFVRPILAGIAAVLMPFAAFRVATSHPQFAFAILIRTAAFQAALAIALAVSAAPVNAMLARLLPMFTDRLTPGAIVSPAHFVVLQQAASRSMPAVLAAIAVACAMVAVLARTGLRVEED